MQWLVHGRMTQALREALRRRGDSLHDVAELDLPPDAPAAAVLDAARLRQWDVLTTDAQVPPASATLPRPFTRSIVLLLVEPGEVEQDDAAERLFTRYKRLSPGRLYTVTAGRVKVRQLRGQC